MPPAGVFVPSLVALNTASLAHAARMYADQGFPVFPLVPHDKKPRVARGFYRATTDPAQIERWWSAWPDANIGLATGEPSGLWVLDVDPRHGGLRSLERLERYVQDWRGPRSLRATLWQLTGGGGLHLCYQMPAQPGTIPPNGAFADYQGIDFKHIGGYIVVPPSRHPSGRLYQWHEDTAPAPFPAALLDIWAATRRCVLTIASAPGARQTLQLPGGTSALARERDPAYWLQVSVRKAAPGSRHRYACFLAIHLVKTVGCSLAEAESWMQAYVAQVRQLPTDPYERDDALRCLRYAWEKYAP